MMNTFIRIIIIIVVLFLNSCGKDKDKVSVIKEESIELQMIDAYKEGLELLNRGDGLGASKKFNDAELLYPQSIWAPRSSLMSAYSLHSSMYYIDAVNELERFLKVYPNHEREVYAYYLLGMSYYDQIIDEKKDLNPLIKAKENFEIVLNGHPDTDFAFDAKLKLEAIQEILAAKEMYTARYYFEREKWIPAINRYKNVLNNYQTTIFIEEALHRLVEIHYRIGLEKEAKKYAILLGYNYNSGEWYEESYKIFNRDYDIVKKQKKEDKKDKLLDKIKSFF